MNTGIKGSLGCRTKERGERGRAGVREEMSSNVQLLDVKKLTPSQASGRSDSMEAPVKCKRDQKSWQQLRHPVVKD